MNAVAYVTAIYHVAVLINRSFDQLTKNHLKSWVRYLFMKTCSILLYKVSENGSVLQTAAKTIVSIVFLLFFLMLPH